MKHADLVELLEHINMFGANTTGTIKRVEHALTALRSGAVVLVPGGPTEEMMQAGNDTGCFERDYPLDSRKEAATVYRAMLACAKEKP